MRRLTLIRHAKSSWEDHAIADFDRPLNRRGRRNAPEMGKRLARQAFQPDAMLTSPARRALSTARIIAGEIAWPPEQLILLPQLYDADREALAEIIRHLDDRWRHVVLFGHNPGLLELANWLGAAIDTLPTGGVLDLELAIARWSALAPQTGRVRDFDYPKNPLADR